MGLEKLTEALRDSGGEVESAGRVRMAEASVLGDKELGPPRSELAPLPPVAFLPGCRLERSDLLDVEGSALIGLCGGFCTDLL